MTAPIDAARTESGQLPPLPAALEAELARLAPVTPRRPTLQVAMLAIASLAYAGGALALLGLRADLRELPLAWLVAAGFLWSCGFAVPAYLALVPRSVSTPYDAAAARRDRGRSMTPRWQSAIAAAVVASIAMVVAGLSVAPHGPHSIHYGRDLLRGHACMWIGLAVALVPAIVGARFLRGALAVQSRTIAAALGAASGSLGGLVLHLHCGIADGSHVGLIHGGVVAVAAVLAAALLPAITDRPFRLRW